ncbi:MAG: hypothetical protein HY804_13040 [Nitrospinae bacterium]|nr:hypothetical protein [Nitrospinota bacterium]
MNDEPNARAPRKGPLPLNEDDLALAFGAAAEAIREPAPPPAPGFSFIKLFIVIVLAAPLATVLALAAADGYERYAKPLGFRASPAPAPEAPARDALAPLVAQFKALQDSLAAALNKQTEAIAALAGRAAESASPPAAAPAETKIIVVKVPSRETFDLDYEKQKIRELAGIDMDDPITNSAPFDKLASRDAVKELIRSFDAIIAAARDHDEVSAFLKSNALEGKKHATSRLRKLK